MKNKAPLALIEQLVMILVFALAAAICLRGFALSDRLSKESEMRDEAVILAQNAAECYKSCRGDAQKAAALLGGTATDAMWQIAFDKDLKPAKTPDTAAFTVTVTPQQTDLSTLGKATVCVYVNDTEAPVFELSVAWQEVTEVGA